MVANTTLDIKQPHTSYVNMDMIKDLLPPIALELSTMSEITYVHIAHLNIPITRLSVHETDHNAYYHVSGIWFYDFLKISQPIILLYRNGVIPIHTPIMFKVGFFQSFKLKRILHTDYLARVVAF